MKFCVECKYHELENIRGSQQHVCSHPELLHLVNKDMRLCVELRSKIFEPNCGTEAKYYEPKVE